jgi:hypothetical protein
MTGSCSDRWSFHRLTKVGKKLLYAARDAAVPFNFARPGALPRVVGITIKKLRELAGKSRPMAVRLRPGRVYAKADILLMTMTAGELTSW